MWGFFHQMKDTLVRGYRIINPWSSKFMVIKQMLSLYCLTFLDVSHPGVWVLPLYLMQWIPLLWQLMLMKMGKENVRHFHLLYTVQHLQICLALFPCCLFALGFQYKAESSFIRHLVFLQCSNISQELWSKSYFNFKVFSNHLFIN